MPGEAGYEEPAVAKTLFTTKDDTIPESYDIREAHKECAPIVGHVRDQSNCG